jgi:hypothetical protein
LLAAATWLVAPGVFAFCRTTTCDVEAERMPPECLPELRDGNHCSQKGAKLYWPGKCISFGVQQDGSKKLGIGWQPTDSVIRAAFIAWTQGVDCGGGLHPSLEVYDLDEVDGPMICPSVEFNKTGANANIWLFSDDEWPYGNADNTFALTTITFDQTGRILDADVELNSFGTNLTLPGASRVDGDLQSIITHEAGHFLGLGHETLVKGATMNAGYTPGTTAFRTLEPDDVNGICTIYPPTAQRPTAQEAPCRCTAFRDTAGARKTRPRCGPGSRRASAAGAPVRSTTPVVVSEGPCGSC